MLVLVVCVGGVFFLHDACVWGRAFSKFVDCKGRRGDGGKVGIGFYMCLCVYVVGGRVG